MKYDVFISAKSEDYDLARDVYKFLKKNGKKPFFAEQELPKLGKSKYIKTICQHLDECDHMVVVSSRLEFIMSEWVEFEWSLFLGEQLIGKEGNLVTVLAEDFHPHSLPIELRHNQSFKIDNYQDDILNYLGGKDIVIKKPEDGPQEPEEEPEEPEDGPKTPGEGPENPEDKPKHEGLFASPRELRTKGVSFKMIPVRGGFFRMGCEDLKESARPVHDVRLDNYYISEVPVTQGLWRAIMGSNPSKCKNDDYPVTNVSWIDCCKFITLLNRECLTTKRFRLPTEAEWEFAARGGNVGRGYNYSGSDKCDEVAWYAENSTMHIHKVGQKSPNELGIYDMSGNVGEWCYDWGAHYLPHEQRNPIGPKIGTMKVVRGGCWNYFDKYCRVTFRGGHVSDDNSSDTIGFRLVMEAK